MLLINVQSNLTYNNHSSVTIVWIAITGLETLLYMTTYLNNTTTFLWLQILEKPDKQQFKVT